MGVSSGLQALISNSNLDPDQFFELKTWVVIVVLSILVGLILVGIFIIFVYNIKIARLYSLQHNFINSFTHELKTPVTSIQLYLETFYKYDLSRDKQLKYIDYMLADASRLTANINRILNLARIESKSFEVQLETLDLVKLIRDFCEKNQHIFKNSEIEILNPEERSFPFSVDVSLFEILLMNLLTNGIKYNDSKSPKIIIEFLQQKQTLRISFTDNGIGIEKNELKKIFKKFYQIKNLKNQPVGGSGLGLYLVDKIARIHDGKVKAESDGVGKGSSFIIIFPWKHFANNTK